MKILRYLEYIYRKQGKNFLLNDDVLQSVAKNLREELYHEYYG